jgi:hypothetical protein
MSYEQTLSTIKSNQSFLPIKLHFIKENKILKSNEDRESNLYPSAFYKTQKHLFRLFSYKPYF